MKKLIILSFLLQLLFSINIYSQFTGYYGKINTRPAYDGEESVVTLRDQNDDGYDDYVICEGNYRLDTLYTLYFFHGDSVIDTVPYYKFSLAFGNIRPRKLFTWDVDKDGYEDLLFSIYSSHYGAVILLYHGGPGLDSIPDQIVKYPDVAGASIGWGLKVEIIPDFDGDGNDELVVWDVNMKNSSLQFGALYFHRIVNGLIETIPFKIIEGDPVTRIRLENVKVRDLNMDGLSDLIIYGHQDSSDYIIYSFNRIYLGNPNWDITEWSQELKGYPSNNGDYILQESIYFRDITMDGKPEIIVKYYGEPYYHKAAFWKGGFPIDTTIKNTINTANIYITTEVAEDFDGNGDGVPDLLMKMFGIANHRISLWLGSSSFEEYPVKQWYPEDFFDGEQGGNIGDVNGDGADDVFMGRTFEDNYEPGWVKIFLGDTSVHVPITKVEDKDNEKPGSFQLLSAYPNPFNPETTIRYELLEDSRASVKVYDILGKEVLQLVDEEQRAGVYEVGLFGSNLASGIYIVRYSYRQSDGIEVIHSLKIEIIK
ncbi:MAG: T9SS type A sorting domain-containing protein [Ignavibacteriaceae bacterium]